LKEFTLEEQFGTRLFVQTAAFEDGSPVSDTRQSLSGGVNIRGGWQV
jgi:hypothetical protein